MLRDAFSHDKDNGGLYCMRAADSCGRHKTVSQLGMRCLERISDFKALLPLLCQGLELPECSVPVPPPELVAALPQSLPALQVQIIGVPFNTDWRT